MFFRVLKEYGIKSFILNLNFGKSISIRINNEFNRDNLNGILFIFFSCLCFKIDFKYYFFFILLWFN